jgi:hypothetical protein
VGRCVARRCMRALVFLTSLSDGQDNQRGREEQEGLGLERYYARHALHVLPREFITILGYAKDELGSGVEAGESPVGAAYAMS